jgi:Putative beta-barrel porin-2, OmpL-like. bbp2
VSRSSRALTGILKVAAGALLLAALPARAQEAAPKPTPEPSPVAEQPKIDVTGFVDVYYEYNFNKVDPALRSFDVQHNAFSLSLAEIAFAKSVTTESRVGFRVDLDFGKTADLVAAYEPEEDGKEIYKHVQQAYLSVLAGSKLQLDVGKFVTPLGAEVIESQDNWNYSRSVLFGYAIPFYHVGVRATLPVNEKVTLNGYLVNGWNNGSEINGNKTLALGATLKPTSKLTWVGTVMSGKETAGSNDTRTLFDTTLTLALTPKLSLMANYDYGKEGDVSWSGIAAYAKFQATPHWALVGRFEYLDDDDGFMTIGQKAKTLTLTSDHLVAGGLKVRLEYRGDFTDSPFFANEHGDSKKSQSAFIIGLVYDFAGKI